MIQADPSQRLNELFSTLTDHLDSRYGSRIIQRSYIATQNSMSMPERAATELETLATHLRAAAETAEALAAALAALRAR